MIGGVRPKQWAKPMLALQSAVQLLILRWRKWLLEWWQLVLLPMSCFHATTEETWSDDWGDLTNLWLWVRDARKPRRRLITCGHLVLHWSTKMSHTPLTGSLELTLQSARITKESDPKKAHNFPGSQTLCKHQALSLHNKMALRQPKSMLRTTIQESWSRSKPRWII